MGHQVAAAYAGRRRNYSDLFAQAVYVCPNTLSHQELQAVRSEIAAENVHAMFLYWSYELGPDAPDVLAMAAQWNHRLSLEQFLTDNPQHPQRLAMLHAGAQQGSVYCSMELKRRYFHNAWTQDGRAGALVLLSMLSIHRLRRSHLADRVSPKPFLKDAERQRELFQYARALVLRHDPDVEHFFNNEILRALYARVIARAKAATMGILFACKAKRMPRDVRLIIAHLVWAGREWNCD